MKQSRVNYTTIYITHKIVSRLLQRLEEQPLQFHRLLMAERTAPRLFTEHQPKNEKENENTTCVS